MTFSFYWNKLVVANAPLSNAELVMRMKVAAFKKALEKAYAAGYTDGKGQDNSRLNPFGPDIGNIFGDIFGK